GGVAAFRKGQAGAISGIEAPDARTLRFELDHPSPTFLNVLALTFAAPVPRKLVAQERRGQGARSLFEEAGATVSSGPFFVKSYVRGQRLQLARNPAY